jgi:hypothetical protein
MTENCETKIIIETDEYILVSDKSKILYAFFCRNRKRLKLTCIDETFELNGDERLFFAKLLDNEFIPISGCCCINPSLIKEYKISAKQITMTDNSALNIESRFKNQIENYFNSFENKLTTP